jgi:hypothetical protein
MLGHLADGMPHVVIFIAGDWVAAHHLVNAARMAVTPFRQHFNGEIAVSDDTHQPLLGVVRNDQHRTDILPLHNLGGDRH